MKTFSLTVLFLVLMFRPLDATVPESFEERLARAELDHAAALGLGYAQEHPKIKGLQAEIMVLEKREGIRNEKYWQILKDKKAMLEIDRDKLVAEGLTPDHPKHQSIQKQLDSIKILLKQKAL